MSIPIEKFPNKLAISDRNTETFVQFYHISRRFENLTEVIWYHIQILYNLFIRRSYGFLTAFRKKQIWSSLEKRYLKNAASPILILKGFKGLYCENKADQQAGA